MPSFLGVLSFSPVDRDDEGGYTCTASNAAGTDSAQVFLTVQCEFACIHSLQCMR